MSAIEYNRRLPLPGAYARAWRELIGRPASQDVRVPGWVVGQPGWSSLSTTAGGALARVRAALDNRINARAGYEPREPREGFGPLLRDSIRVRDRLVRRVRVYQFETREARRRLSHLLASRDD